MTSEVPGRAIRRFAARLLAFLATTCMLAGAMADPARDDAKPDPNKRLIELGVSLPAPDKPFANYVKAVRTGNLVFLAGHGPCGTLDESVKGKVGRDLTVEQGYEVARKTAICLLATLKAEIGDLAKVRRIVKVLGMVNAPEGFTDHPKVINGASDLFVAVFGDAGRHARSAVGVASLPMNIAVEIEMIVEVEGG